MSGHYASADMGRLVELANPVLNRHETRTVLRVTAVTKRTWILRSKSFDLWRGWQDSNPRPLGS